MIECLLSTYEELHSFIDLPERLGCLASGRSRQHPVGADRTRSGQSISVRDRLHPLPETYLFGVGDDRIVAIGD